MRAHLVGALALAAAALSSAGCTPSCDQTCRRLFNCESLEVYGMTEDTCVEDCLYQEAVYERWDDVELREAYQESRRCVADATCEDLAAGVCFDETLYPY
ncbi:hypothetical protein L6R46_14125 [Myxococcota bacterium]|nr:hypothetical protein [Myxococcota bacterium]